MKVRDTSRGRMYAVASNPGCTVINGVMAVDVPAGGQSVILALDKKLIIDGDDDAKFVEVRWGTNAAIGSRPAPSWIGDVVDGLVSIVGADNFDVNYIPAENKLYLVFSLDTTNEQIEEVDSLLESVLPGNVVTEMEWADGFPVSYTRLEYIEGTGKQWIITDFVPNNDSGIFARYINNNGNTKHPVSTSETIDGVKYGIAVATIRNVSSRTSVWGNKQVDPSPVTATVTAICEGEINYLNCKMVRWRDKETNVNSSRIMLTNYPNPLNYEPTVSLHFCKDLWYRSSTNFCGKLLEARFSQGEHDACVFVPALDDTGAPCMFDLLARKAFYNSGTGDFTYPTDAAPAVSADLDEKFYAKLTEHGIRRLYHVPKGYTGTKDQYAAEHGFKELVEPPMPQEGYWTNEWRDTETQLICEWVETEEPPTEEELQIEEIENA